MSTSHSGHDILTRQLLNVVPALIAATDHGQVQFFIRRIARRGRRRAEMDARGERGEPGSAGQELTAMQGGGHEPILCAKRNRMKTRVKFE